MIAHRPDWTLSRQRQWGVPLPFFVDRTTDTLHPDTMALLELAAVKVEAGGIESWFEATCEDFGVDEKRYRKLTDTLDVWFDSGATFETVLGGPDGRRTGMGSHPQQTGFPADLYLEGSDQHRGWFHSSLLESCMVNGVPPYKALLTHGFAVDGEGKKMSKSKGNVVAPQKVCDTLGAEILRLWVAATDYSGELSISDEILKRVVESYRRIRNTLRFLLANTSDFDPVRDALPVEALLEIDRFALAQATMLTNAVEADYARYEFHLVVQRLQTYCSEELGGFYLDVLKDRLYTTAADGAARRSAQTALALIRDMLLKLMAPILSFTAEEAWRILHPEDRSVFVSVWAHSLPDVPDAPELDQEVGAHSRRARAGAEGARDGAARRRHRLVASGRSRHRRARGRPRRAGRARRRPALRDHHVGGERRAWRCAGRAGDPERTPRSVIAAGTGVPMSAPTARGRRCADAALPTCPARARRAATPDRTRIRRRHTPGREAGDARAASAAWWRWLLLSAAVVAADLVTKAVGDGGFSRRAGAAGDRVLQPRIGVQQRRRIQLSVPAHPAGSAGSSRRWPSRPACSSSGCCAAAAAGCCAPGWR